VILINGQPDNRIPATDRGLQYGDGLFETLAFREGRLEFLNAHLQRLMLGCERLGIPFPDKHKLQLELATLCAQTAEDSVIKIMLTRGSGGRGYKAPAEADPLRIISSHPMPDYPDSCREGVTARLCRYRLGVNPNLAGIKHLNRLEQVLARSEWDDEEIREGLMLDINDNLIEGTMSNLFLIDKGQIMTPAIDQNGIAGIMRAEVIKLAAKLDIPVSEKTLTFNDLQRADEVFVTNSIIEIWPLTQLIDPEQHWPHGILTRRLQSELEQTER